MAGDSEAPYTVIETPEFLGLIEDVLGSIRRWDEIKWARDWLLEKSPMCGNYLPHYNLWVLFFRTEPTIVVYYEIMESRRQVIPRDIQILHS